MKKFDFVVLTCEHASSAIPVEVQNKFLGKEKFLASHRGYDSGSLTIANYLSKALMAPLFVAKVSRLVVDHNRSEHHPGLHWGPVQALPLVQRQRLIRRYYRPFRKQVLQKISSLLEQKKRVLHLSIHTFTPILRSKPRSTEIGLLYDPDRSLEAELSAAWRLLLVDNHQQWRVRRNYPYVGWSDGHTAALRQVFAERFYAGLEIEVSQRLVRQRKELQVANLLVQTLKPFLRS